MDNETDKCLREALTLLNKDLEKELQQLKASPSIEYINPEKYEQAKKLFLTVLKKIPNHKAALDGLAVCEIMLPPYYPIQYMIDPNMPLNIMLDETQASSEIKTPW